MFGVVFHIFIPTFQMCIGKLINWSQLKKVKCLSGVAVVDDTLLCANVTERGLLGSAPGSRREIQLRYR